ncbi:putative manganese-dependent inorganic diphosphatase [Acidaminobacter sp. JC074]|uniref:putative manganese-dependent inorganic diphosphatase n=1 Tax=Acidaminobacter sp. JC074 TaxID=2530199 RepID=UPI001F10B027|nr:putative manganese-dependent inorganic diphosphatase [Acidaminobacter sp. JC074]
MNTLIFGHKNPDSDSILSSIALSYMKNQLGQKTEACRLGEMNEETKFILDYFGLEAPRLIDDVKVQVSDLDYICPMALKPTNSIKKAYDLMKRESLRQVAIVDDDGKFLGIVSIKDIAMSFIEEDFSKINTRTRNLLNVLGGTLIAGVEGEISGKIPKIHSYYNLAKKDVKVNETDILILPDDHEMISSVLEMNPRLLIVCGLDSLPQSMLDMVDEEKTTIIGSSKDIYATSRLLTQSNFLSHIMLTKGISKFSLNEYIEDVIEIIHEKPHVQFPIVSDDNSYIGFISRRHVMLPRRKKVILVDHNEFSQSALGIEEAEITEIVDHHKIGCIQTPVPIEFINKPVGSTCTIVYALLKENKVEISRSIAGAILSGILSDTLMLKSPTSTNLDKEYIEELSDYLGIDYKEYSMEMFKVGTSIQNLSLEEIFSKDYKEFNIESTKVGISQVFTLDFEEISQNEEAIVKHIEGINQLNKHDVTIMLVTDIVRNGSYIYYASTYNLLLSNAFECDCNQGTFIPELLSRKKQVLPKLIRSLELIK